MEEEGAERALVDGAPVPVEPPPTPGTETLGSFGVLLPPPETPGTFTLGAWGSDGALGTLGAGRLGVDGAGTEGTDT